MKKYLLSAGIILAVTSCLWFYGFREKSPENPSKTLTIPLKDYLLSSFLAELPVLNKKLPYKLDETTVLMSIEYKNEKIIHVYELPKYKKNKGSEGNFFQSLIPFLKEQACFDPARQNMLAAGIDFLSMYRDSAGQLIFEIPINQSSCAEMTPTLPKP